MRASSWPARPLDLPDSLSLTHCVALVDGWLLAGHTSGGAAFSDRVWVCRTKPDGKRRWTARLGSESDHTQLRGLAPLSDGGFALGGSRTWRAGEDARGFVTALGPKGRERWGVDFGQLESNGVADICAGSGGRCVYARHEYLPTVEQPGRDDWKGHDWLCGLDARGDENWRRALDWPVSHGAVKQLLSLGGSDVAALVAASVWGAGSQDCPLWLTLVGGELRQTLLRTSRIAEPVACAGSPGGGAAILGGVSWTPIGPKAEPVLLRIDSAADVQWERSYGDPARDAPTCLVAYRDGFVVGGLRMLDGEGHPPPSAVWLLGVDAQGEPRWRHDLHSGHVDRLNALDVDRFGRILAVGSTRRDSRSSGWTLSLAPGGDLEDWFTWRGLRLRPPQ